MDPEVNKQLDKERRILLLSTNDPETQKLRDNIRESLAPAVKPDIDLDKLTETLLIATLLYASKDKLSGLSNKDRLRVEVNAAMAVARRLNIPLTLLYMDGRHFKEVNDKFGHTVGDDVIRAIGKGIQASIRSTDITLSQIQDETVPNDEPNIEAARDGGDEFAAVLLGADLNSAVIVSDRIQNHVNKAIMLTIPQFQQTLGHPFELTISIIQYNPAVHQNAESLIKAADDNLTLMRQQMGQSRRN